MTCAVGWQSLSFYSTAIRSKISLGRKGEIVIPVLKLIGVIAAYVLLSMLESALVMRLVC